MEWYGERQKENVGIAPFRLVDGKLKEFMFWLIFFYEIVAWLDCNLNILSIHIIVMF